MLLLYLFRSLLGQRTSQLLRIIIAIERKIVYNHTIIIIYTHNSSVNDMCIYLYVIIIYNVSVSN